MNKKFSPHWKASSQPRKQRKYRHHAPLHVKKKFLSSHLSKELRKKYRTRNLKVRTGDRVRIQRGQFKGKEGKIEEVDAKKSKVYIAKVETTKKDGSKTRIPVNPSNLLVLELNLDDKKRAGKLKQLEEGTVKTHG
ncbi:MAG: 50S ribosomal protein L24 [Nanoarchaeota archaeon]